MLTVWIKVLGLHVLPIQPISITRRHKLLMRLRDSKDEDRCIESYLLEVEECLKFNDLEEMKTSEKCVDIDQLI